MKCPRCQYENQSGAKFCQECSAPLAQACSNCGSRLPEGAKFCPGCAHAVAATASALLGFGSPESYTPKHLAERILTSKSALEGERKLVTVLFCDIANSTALAERLGPEAMHTVLNRFFALALAEVHRYEGTVNQFLGDGFMALFGAPIAHEDHARRAVLAALGVQRRVHEDWRGLENENRLVLRMGLNTGPVVVGAIGDNLRMDYTAVGDTTNLAARLQQHAEPDSALVSDATARLVQGYVRLEALPPFAVKGKAEPVTAFRLIGLGTRRSTLEAGTEERALSPFLGRDRELGTLLDAYAETEAGRGQVVGLVGEAGVGKSRLLYEFRQGLGDRGTQWLEARCLSFGSAIPYLPVQDLVRQSCGINETDTPVEIGEKLRTALEGVEMDAHEDVPYLLQLLALKEGTEQLAQIRAETIKTRIFLAVRELILRRSQSNPVALAIEDVHWIDKTSEEFFTQVVDSVAGASVLLLASHRPGYRPPWMDKSYVTQISLRPLSPDDSLRLVQSMVQRLGQAPQAAETIARKAEGNPFFLEELTRAMLEGRDQESVHPSLPETIQAVLLARIDRLPAEVKRVLQTAAVLGREFSRRLLEAVSGLTEELASHLSLLRHLEFVYERGSAEEPVCVFKHALTQEVAYDSLLAERRAALHEATARAIEAIYPSRLEERYELLAHHFSRSAASEKALDYLELANRKAAAASAMTEAKGYFEEAYRRLTGPAQTATQQRRRIGLLEKQWDVYQQLVATSEYAELVVREEPVAVSLGDPALLGVFYTSLGHCQYYAGAFDKAIATGIKAAELCEATGNAAEAAHAFMYVEWSCFWSGDLLRALAFKDQVMRITAHHFNLPFHAYSLGGAAMACAFLGRWQEALELGQEELRVATEFGNPSHASFALWNLAIADMHRGDLPRALEHGDLAIQEAPTAADQGWSQLYRSWCWCKAGQARKAAELLSELLPRYKAGGFLAIEVQALQILGEAYCITGEDEKAERVLEELLQVAGRSRMKWYLGVAYRLLGDLATRAGAAATQPDPGILYFEQSIVLFKEIGAENELALTYVSYARLKRNLGSLSEARDHLTQALEIFTRLGTLGQPDKVRVELESLRLQ